MEVNRIVRIALVVVTLGIIAGLGFLWLNRSRTQHLTLAAGSRDGESFILGEALKTVVQRHYPAIEVTVLETGGTAENLRMLASGQAQLATAQADVMPGPAARILAVLYDDTFQLLVPADSTIRSFADLRGKRIGLAQRGGQFESFLRVAEHFGLHAAEFQFVGSSDAAADEAFRNGQADAIFRVRALGNPSIQRLVQRGDVRFLAIEHAAAMKIKYPAFETATIPEGSYRGNPPVPARDLPTVAVHRTLLAHQAVDQDAIRAITEVLIERRQEVMQEIPAEMAEVRLLLAQVRRPEAQRELGPPLHPGALSFYDKDRPSFLLAHADYVGLMLTVALMAGSWIWELKQWMLRQQKNTADQYSNRAVALMNSAQGTASMADLDEIWRELQAILTRAVHDLDEDKLSGESFNSFRCILQIALDVTRERRAMVSGGVGVAVTA
ncbi:MAG TPA: TAXI family TRAP transporter solute-binding subunit [Bryobacteraceae bacterium]